jgi:environmental stress-induced protein Ves
MSINVINYADYRETPWKNGGGVTHEIARSDDSSEPDWRISLATIDRDGPFSDFTGFDRTIVPIGGTGFVLSFDDGERHKLEADQYARRPFSFAGEKKVECRLLDGPSQDLNVMTRRSRWRHDVEVNQLSYQPIDLEMRRRSFLFAIGDITVVHAGGMIEMRGGSTLAFDGRVPVNVRSYAEEASLVVICITRRWRLW